MRRPRGPPTGIARAHDPRGCVAVWSCCWGPGRPRRPTRTGRKSRPTATARPPIRRRSRCPTCRSSASTRPRPRPPASTNCRRGGWCSIPICRWTTEIRRLPEVFDQAFPQWCDYFRVRPADHADWRMTGLHHQGQGPVRIDGPAAGRPAAFSPRLFAERPCCGSTSSPAIIIAATCCCTKGRTGS